MQDKLLLIYLVGLTILGTSLASQNVPDCQHNGPLGVISGKILDWQITASSTYPEEWDPGCHERYARLYQPNGKGWCAKHKSASEWLQVDLGVTSKITGVMTQGRGDGNEWVTTFMVSYSMDAFHWSYVADLYGNQRLFEGNTDSYSAKHSYLDSPIYARFIKFHTVSWHRHPSLRVEVLGCQTCNELIGLPPYGKISASSHHTFKRGSSCLPEYGHALSNKAWCSKHDDENQWLQFDVGPPTLVTGVVTKGRGDLKKKEWVERFRVSYSNDSRVWYFYKDESHLAPRIFGGNDDKDTARYHFLNSPFTARYIRIHPSEWHGSIAMRAGLLGCPHSGKCGFGFTQVNGDTPCIENIAYKKESFINKKQQYKRHTRMSWMHGHAGRAVDGNYDTSLHSCTILDNSQVDQPVWMVDLGRKTEVSGLMVYTWQGKGQGESTYTHYPEQDKTYRDYMYNLDRITVYVDTRASRDIIQVPENKCGYISRLNNALFKPRLHIECLKPLKGRYVFIEATGVANRWSRLFSAVLCEVEVY